MSKFFHLGVAGLLWAWESLACKIFLATRSSAFGFHFLLLFCSYPRTQTGSRRQSRCFNILYIISLHASLQGLKPVLSSWGGICGSSEAAPWKAGQSVSGQLVSPLLKMISCACAEFKFSGCCILSSTLIWTAGKGWNKSICIMYLAFVFHVQVLNFSIPRCFVIYLKQPWHLRSHGAPSLTSASMHVLPLYF